MKGKELVTNRFYKYLLPNMGSAFDSIVSALYCMFGIGGSICYAKYQGMANGRKAQERYSLAVMCAAVSSLIITVVCLVSPEILPGILCKSNTLRPMFDSYIHIKVIAAPFVCVLGVAGAAYATFTSMQ